MTNTGKSRNFNSRKNGNSSPTNSSGSGNDNKPSKKTLANYVYYIRTPKQAADYQTTTDSIINHITKTFDFGNDIATALS
jgi:hypothetical protein